ncbi:MAG: primosomal protein N' [Puniceicoccales bacterium]|jgi:primosomal protein N' (replication factor Y)|nr:primosomal protein N' [Puniceicoccales bacterium]
MTQVLTEYATVEFFDALGKPLSYAVPPPLREHLTIGSLVEVPLALRPANVDEEQLVMDFAETGQKIRHVPAIVVDLSPPEFHGPLRNIHKLLCQKPVVSPKLLQLIRRLSNYYHSSLRGFLKMVVPNFLRRNLAKKSLKNPKNVIVDARPEFTNFPLPLDAIFSAQLLMGHSSHRFASYIVAIEHALRCGSQVLVLCPDMRWAQKIFAQLTAALSEKFSHDICALWDGSSSTQKCYTLLNRLIGGETFVLIGTRSALFLPFSRLGLIIVERAENWRHRQDHHPRFHGRDGAIWRAKLENIPCILGSAAPPLEIVHAQRNGKVQFVPAKHIPRLKNVKICLVDRRDLPPQDWTIAPLLLKKLRCLLAHGKRAALIHPQKGFSRVYCRKCCAVLRCIYCSTPMTFDAQEKQYRCGRCSHFIDAKTPVRCPKCSTCLRRVGSGTQKIVQRIEEVFPHNRCIRCDGRGPFHKILAAPFDILVGTSAILPELDRCEIALLAHLDLDHLFFPRHFRSAECAFQALHELLDCFPPDKFPDELVLQTSNPQHPALQSFIANDHEIFYENELRARENLDYPPFKHLLCQEFRSDDNDLLNQFANSWAERLRQTFSGQNDVKFHGPLRSIPPKAGTLWRVEFWFFTDRPNALSRKVDAMQREEDAIPANIQPLALDVDPLEHPFGTDS